ncbi:LacI family DNA-binding transcriptional regulator [Glycomyces buryatensis]|uniref:LacI family transcriptional regulator n=1 Tax=Glycomyces buryatensis TaxID=2570927 RepID=A0A4S8QF62_9ACTN|nr:LacI family DNA-binding transcriptional regulator [Glycomyces buryatensis]THV43048.1 LacI family transcriptional regulator [Glycomyces buryatensis]
MTGHVRSPVKLAIIAREVGVSVSTVSKVINGRADVAAATRARVREALARHAYPLEPSRTRDAKVGSALLDVVIHELDSAWAATILTEVERAAAAQGLNIVVSTVQTELPTPVPPRRWLDQVAARGACGVLGILVDLTRAQVDYLTDAAIPCVVIDPAVRLDPPVTTVHLSNHHSQYRLIEHLISLGHRDIAVVSGNPLSLPAQERLEGFRAAMADAGLAVRPEWCREGGFSRTGSHEAMTELMALEERPTAVAFASDKGALGGLAAANRLGLKVPEDVSITGFDDIPDAKTAMPPLTTVRQPVRELVEEAIRRITAEDSGGRIVCEAEPVIRASTAPPTTPS